MNRKYSLDFLKVLSMFMVVFLHVNRHSGHWPPTIDHNGATWWSSVIGEMFCIVAVNLYALITGYVSIETRWKLSRYINLWFLVAFYTLGITLITILTKGIDNISYSSIINWFTPIPFAGAHWFFTAYSFLFIFIPFINKALNNSSKAAHLALVIFIIVLLPLFNIFDKENIVDSGYNFAWLCCMYVVGAYMKKYPTSLSLRLSSCIYCSILVLQIILCWLIRPGMTSYTLPTVTLASVFLFIVFTKIEMRDNYVAKLVPYVFGVYIIHEHPAIASILNKNLPHYCNHFISPLLYTPLIFCFCLLITYITKVIFKLSKIDKLLNYIGEAIQNKIFAVSNWLAQKL